MIAAVVGAGVGGGGERAERAAGRAAVADREADVAALQQRGRRRAGPGRRRGPWCGRRSSAAAGRRRAPAARRSRSRRAGRCAPRRSARRSRRRRRGRPSQRCRAASRRRARRRCRARPAAAAGASSSPSSAAPSAAAASGLHGPAGPAPRCSTAVSCASTSLRSWKPRRPRPWQKRTTLDFAVPAAAASSLTDQKTTAPGCASTASATLRSEAPSAGSWARRCGSSGRATAFTPPTVAVRRSARVKKA